MFISTNHRGDHGGEDDGEDPGDRGGLAGGGLDQPDGDAGDGGDGPSGPGRGQGSGRSCVMSVSSEADPEGIRGWCGSRLWWRSPSARRLHQTVRTGDFADAAAAPGAYGHAAVAWKPLVGNHAPRSGPEQAATHGDLPGTV
jgi:hypothetical protein